ncbi:MAG: PQQ-binding-like beta-propeller repeat protein, partial [Acidobacteriota bacterium]
QIVASNSAWSVETPPGHSSPVVWEDHIYLSACVDGTLECRAYDKAKGALLWSRPVKTESLEKTHAFSNPVAPSAAANAECVIFRFGSFGLLAFSHEGKPLWETKLPPQVSRGGYGSASSPVICGDIVVQTLDSDEGGSRIVAFKTATGTKAWETERPLFTAGWSSPAICRKDGKCEIVVLGSKKLVSYAPEDGRVLWTVPGFPLETSCSPAFDGERVYCCSAALGGRSSAKFDWSGFEQLKQFDSNKDGKIQPEEVPQDFKLVIRPELPEGHPGRQLPFDIRGMIRGMDADKDGGLTEEEWNKAMAEFEKMDTPVAMALKIGDAGSVSDRIVWQQARGVPEVPSVLAYMGKLFLIRDGGILRCLDSQTGEVLFDERIGAAGGYSASPVGADGRVYLASQAGVVTIIDARSNSLKVLGQANLSEKVCATPALVGNAIYVRTDKHLVAFR